MTEKDSYSAWVKAHEARALLQGWCIFVTDHDPDSTKEVINGRPYGYRPYEIQALDEANVFHNDRAAWEYVMRNAEHGFPEAVSALQFLKTFSRPEYEAIYRECK